MLRQRRMLLSVHYFHFHRQLLGVTTASARDGRGDPRSGRGKSLRRGRTKEWTGEGRVLTRLGAIGGVILFGELGRLLWEELELARIRVGRGRDCLVVTADLDVVVVLEVEGEVHERGGDVGGGLVGYGELVLLLCAAFAGHRVSRRSRPWCGSSCLR